MELVSSAPALIALVALVVALLLVLPPEGRPQTNTRNVASFVLLLIAFSIGSCYAGVIASLPGSKADFSMQGVGLATLGAIGFATFGYVYRIRITSRSHPAPSEPAEGKPRGADGVIAVVLVLLMGLGLAAIVVGVFLN